MNEKIYDIWLQQALGYNNNKVKIIYHLYKSIKQFYEYGETEWRLCGCLTNNQIKCLHDTSLDSAKKIFETCMKLKYEVITFSDKEYPYLLSQLSNPPIVIYAKGDISCLHSKLILSVVGTRNPTMYGIEMAKDIAYHIACEGGVVVSGGALGVDTAAHRGALNAKGKTVAVLGCGINFPYLSSNECLRNKISESGALISEYPPNYPVYSYNFPIRNRIISGLSLGTIVIEAGQKSGSLITANLANDQNRDVFVVPVNEINPLSIGATSLISDGARVLVNINDVIDEYRFKLENKPLKESNHFKLNYSLSYKQNEKLTSENSNSESNHLDVSENAKIVYNLIGNKKMHVNDICEASSLITSKVLAALTELEIYGLIRNYKGREYERVSPNY